MNIFWSLAVLKNTLVKHFINFELPVNAFGAEQQPVDHRVTAIKSTKSGCKTYPGPSKPYFKPKTYNRFNLSTELSKTASQQPWPISWLIKRLCTECVQSWLCAQPYTNNNCN